MVVMVDTGVAESVPLWLRECECLFSEVSMEEPYAGPL